MDLVITLQDKISVRSKSNIEMSVVEPEIKKQQTILIRIKKTLLDPIKS